MHATEILSLVNDMANFWAWRVEWLLINEVERDGRTQELERKRRVRHRRSFGIGTGTTTWKDITSHEWVAAIASVERWAEAVQLYMGYVRAGVLNSEHDVEDFKSYRVDAIGYQDSRAVPRMDLGDQILSAWALELGQSDIEAWFGRNARIQHHAGGGKNRRDIPVTTSLDKGGGLIVHSDIAVVQFISITLKWLRGDVGTPSFVNADWDPYKHFPQVPKPAVTSSY
ncbi:hypothetical protein ARMSODRAFT_1008989 [Armillaria solidipes]|uniref:Uncharacterized protein n=1 Tax=Armillaria solidipes TaxID=1076256 RepID=A0A2H3B4M9_9AGAR|nr:hypothetical protein ARMSODRAFT_1008989 [Armillaria solidipes]